MQTNLAGTCSDNQYPKYTHTSGLAGGMTLLLLLCLLDADLMPLLTCCFHNGKIVQREW